MREEILQIEAQLRNDMLTSGRISRLGQQSATAVDLLIDGDAARWPDPTARRSRYLRTWAEIDGEWRIIGGRVCNLAQT